MKVNDSLSQLTKLRLTKVLNQQRKKYLHHNNALWNWIAFLRVHVHTSIHGILIWGLHNMIQTEIEEDKYDRTVYSKQLKIEAYVAPQLWNNYGWCSLPIKSRKAPTHNNSYTHIHVHCELVHYLLLFFHVWDEVIGEAGHGWPESSPKLNTIQVTHVWLRMESIVYKHHKLRQSATTKLTDYKEIQTKCTLNTHV